MAAPVLGGTTLAHPSTYSRDEILQGAVNEMASGKNVVDVIEPGSIGNHRVIYRMGWENITSAQHENISSKYWAMVTDGTATFQSPDGDSVNVQPTKNIGLRVEAVKVAGSTLKYNVTCELQEYS